MSESKRKREFLEPFGTAIGDNFWEIYQIYLDNIFFRTDHVIGMFQTRSVEKSADLIEALLNKKFLPKISNAKLQTID